MFTRALVLALWCASASALTPLSAAGDDNECALYLSGPGRTSAYDYSLNLLKGNFGYEGQHTCITYDAVNQAYSEARNRIVVSQPKGDWKPEDFASVGELILDISISLARTYGLTYEEIEKGLPLIDTSRTLIREVCPPVFSHVECRAGKYRRLDGLCNNLNHPTWGATNAPFQRLIGPLFADGINAPRISHTGRDLPLSRVVSRTMHPDDGFHDHAGTVMVIAWGQFMDHDYTLTGTPLDPVNRNDPEECCKRPPHLKHPYCNEIRVPEDDYFYRLFGVKCIDFVRGFPSPRPGCRLGSRNPFNTLTGVIDGNTVYGVTDKFARKLRTGYGGLLRMNPVFKEYGLKDLLPLKLDIPDEGCTRPNKNMYCFEAGEIRVNEQLVLTVMHTLMAREHNRVANALAEVNPHWDDETLYQEARRINIAEIQHITYNEFLPILLGKDVMEKFGLVLEKEGYWEGYDPEVNPDVIASFAAAAYRFGHSLLPTAVERWSKAHKFIASKRLSDLIRRPYDLYRAGVLDEYVMGLMNQVAQAMDDSITQEVTNHLFKKVGARFGMDLVSFNMQRGREFGLPGYMEFRKFCGLSGADTFQDLFGTMSNETVRKYETIFEHPIDVDLWSGGVSERPLPGSMLGPTFACVIATQFSYSRRGDRFWFELPNQPSTFTPEQLAEIRKSRLARVICDNTDIIDTVQLYPMVLPDHELNPRVPCRSGIIPSMDFTKWAEPAPAPFRGAAKQFVTNAYIQDNAHTNCSESTGSKNDSSTTNPNPAKRDTNCNITNDFIHNQKGNLITVKITANASTNGDNHTNTISACADNAKNITNDCFERIIKTNEIPESNTVLKYVYKNNDEKSFRKGKSAGHPLNSIRKKRDVVLDSKLENITTDASVNAPLIVNYETYHAPGENNDALELPVYKRLTKNTIQNSALADFNIKTLHEPSQPPKNNDIQSENSSSRSAEDSKEPGETKDYKSDENQSNSEESLEQQDNQKNFKKPHSDYIKSGISDDESDEIQVKHPYKKRTSSNEDSRGISEEDEESSQKSTESYKKHDDHPQGSEKRFESYDDEHPRKTDGSFELYEEPPRKTEGSFEKYEEIPQKTEGSFEKYEDHEDPPKNAAHAEPRQSAESYESKETNLESSQSVKNSGSQESRENNDSKTPAKARFRRIKDDSQEHNDRGDYKDVSGDNNGSEEAEKAPNKEIKDESLESNDRGDYRDQKPRYENHKQYPREEIKHKKQRDSEQSLEDNYENNKHHTKRLQNDSHVKRFNKKAPDHGHTLGTPPTIQDIGLDKFSYERVRANDEGQILPVAEHDDKKPFISVEAIVESDLDNEKHIASLPSSEIDEHLRSEIYESIKQPIRKYDGEIKPVVELNNENNGGASSEEFSKESIKSDPEKDVSLESILDVKQKVIIDHDDEQKKTQENGDVKQQFERIPTNYKHDNSKVEENDKTVQETQKETPTDSEIHNEGTLDTLSPKDINYDEHLKFKFDDISIKLPEIKLPEDILAYAYEEPSYDKKSDSYAKRKYSPKKKFFQYSDENTEDSPDKDKKSETHNGEDDDDHHYYGYYGSNEKKQKLKKKENSEEDDEGIDLYEKFVRERFGKQGSFEKRSEKLQNAENLPHNPKLYDTVQHILKQTAQIDKQAKKSGDPNAGYMWTLEYGEKL